MIFVWTTYQENAENVPNFKSNYELSFQICPTWEKSPIEDQISIEMKHSNSSRVGI